MKNYWADRVMPKRFENSFKKIYVEKYDRIYIGCPCCNYSYTPPIKQLLKQLNYKNKEFVFFLRHGGGMRNRINKFKNNLAGGVFVGSMDFSNAAKTKEKKLRNDIKNKLNKIGG